MNNEYFLEKIDEVLLRLEESGEIVITTPIPQKISKFDGFGNG